MLTRNYSQILKEEHMAHFYPDTLDGRINFYETFLAGAATNMAIIKYDQPMLDAMTAKLNALKEAKAEMLAAKIAVKKAVEKKDENMTIVGDDIKKKSKLIQADDDIPNYVREDMGLPIHDTTPSFETPKQVIKVLAKGLSANVNDVDWDANGNPSRTLYIVEAKYNDDAEFAQVGTVLATKFRHKGQIPGVKVIYRVIAQRGDRQSLPSDPAIVYP